MRRLRLLAAPLAAVALTSCGTPPPGTARDVRFSDAAAKGRVVTEAELQSDLERFATRLMESAAEGLAPFNTADTAIREIAMRRTLLYASSALDIASGATPEISLLDMIVFVSLSRRVLEVHWIPAVFGEKGRPLLNAFVEADRDLWKVSAKVLTDEQQTKLRTLIADWVKENPDKIRVEAVRLSDFAMLAGRISERRAKETGGLFGAVRSATVAADEAVLLGQRAMFVTNRMPFLVRLQARLGASEIVTDSLNRFEDMKHLADALPQVRSLLDELVPLVRDSKSTVLEAREALKALEPVLAQIPQILAQIPPQDQLQKTIGDANKLTERANDLTNKAGGLLSDVHAMLPANPGESASAITVAADRLLRRWALYLLGIGAAWSLFFWGGYYVFKRLAAARMRSISSRDHDEPGDSADDHHAAPPSHH